MGGYHTQAVNSITTSCFYFPYTNFVSPVFSRYSISSKEGLSESYFINYSFTSLFLMSILLMINQEDVIKTIRILGQCEKKIEIQCWNNFIN